MVQVAWDVAGSPADIDSGIAVFLDGAMSDYVGQARLTTDNGALEHGSDRRSIDGSHYHETVRVDLARIATESCVVVYVLATEAGAAGALANLKVSISNTATGTTLFTAPFDALNKEASALQLISIVRDGDGWTARSLGTAATARAASELVAPA